MTERLFITGGTGFFGKSMLDYRLRHPEWRWSKAEWVILSRSPKKFLATYPKLANQNGVSYIVGDVRDFIFPKGWFTAIIHAAANAVDMPSDEETASVIIEGAQHVAEFSQSKSCAKVLFISSGAVYGPRISVAREEDECCPETAYGKGKLRAEKILVDAGLDVKIARCFAFVGPYLDKEHYAIGNFIRDCMGGQEIIVQGDGTPLRSYLYSDDLVEWLFEILDRGKRNRVYNVGSGEALSIRALAEKVRRVLGATNGLKVKRLPMGDPPLVYVPDVSRARLELSLEPKTRLESAILKSV